MGGGAGDQVMGRFAETIMQSGQAKPRLEEEVKITLKIRGEKKGRHLDPRLVQKVVN